MNQNPLKQRPVAIICLTLPLLLAVAAVPTARSSSRVDIENTTSLSTWYRDAVRAVLRCWRTPKAERHRCRSRESSPRSNAWREIRDRHVERSAPGKEVESPAPSLAPNPSLVPDPVPVPAPSLAPVPVPITEDTVKSSPAQSASLSTGTASDSASSVTQVTSGRSPTLSISLSHSVIGSGEDVHLNWHSNDATHCAASGGWQGRRAMSGSEIIQGVTANQSYVLRCDNPAGFTSRTVQVKVLGKFDFAWQPPTRNTDGSPILGLSEYRVYRGDRSRQYVEVVAVPGDTSSYTIRADVGTHYVAVTAVDLLGRESDFSNEIARTLR